MVMAGGGGSGLGKRLERKINILFGCYFFFEVLRKFYMIN